MSRPAPDVVGIAGPAGAGKDTVADIIIDLYGGSKASFALPLKLGLSAMLGADFVHMGRDEKETPMEDLGITPRRLMQTLGTEWGRQLVDESIWVKALDRHIRQNPGFYVVPDTRFTNEVSWVKGRGGLMVYVDRPNLPQVEAHVSEHDVSASEADVVIINDVSLADLPALVKRTLHDRL